MTIMPPGRQGLKALIRAAYGPSSIDTICFSCRRSLRIQTQHREVRRREASTAAVAHDASTNPEASPLLSSNAGEPTPATPGVRPTYQIHAGIVLSRAPTLTRELTPFEKAFYLYQRRLNERLALPFTRYFYIKKGTPADLEWKRKMRERLTPARDIGVYNAYKNDAWNDELLLGDETSEPSSQVEALLRDAESPEAIAEEGMGEAPQRGDETEEKIEKAKAEQMVQQSAGKKEELERPASRISESDQNGDDRSLNRMGWRTLYLLVKGEGGKWQFPSARLMHKETLQQGAERALIDGAGRNMNTWTVGGQPIGHYAADFRKPLLNADAGTLELGEKVFFVKGRILGGQANLAGSKLGLTDFKWLAKEEIRAHVHSKYYSMVEDMLAQR